jgi:hypothetical protein
MDPDKKQNKRRLYNKKWMSEKRRKIQSQREQSKLETDSESCQCSNVIHGANSSEDIRDAHNVPISNNHTTCVTMYHLTMITMVD